MARILITGASRGIGRGTAVALAGRGHEVIATARDVAALDDVPAALRLSLDVTSQASVDAAIARAGHVDVWSAMPGRRFARRSRRFRWRRSSNSSS